MLCDGPTMVGRGVSRRVSAQTTSSWSATVNAGPSGRLTVDSDNRVATGNAPDESAYVSR